jgi:hypothetical protein|tara:strand:- start:651 stop:1241 length:591 start_codon:yes stop_codon:yes gene_type:complete
MAAIDFTNLKNQLNSFGKEVVRNAKKNLKEGGKGGGNLEKSIDFKVVPDGKGFVVQFYMADYGAFQDKGVKGAGGKIKTGEHKGSWGGRRHYIDWKGNRKDSPYQYGSGKGKKNGIYKGIGSFIKKKGLQPRSAGGQYMTTTGLKIAIVKVLWIKGIHGISFFQNSLMLGMKKFGKELLGAVKEDIIQELQTTTVK